MKTRIKVPSGFLASALLAIGGGLWLPLSSDGPVQLATERLGPEITDGPGRKLVIEPRVVKDGEAHFGTTLSLPMPALLLHEAGEKTNHVAAGEVVQQVWGSMLHGVTGLAGRPGRAIKEGWNQLFR